MTKVPFDDFLDVCFAEIYNLARDLEEADEITIEDDVAATCEFCKQVAAEFLEQYHKNNEAFLNGKNNHNPDFWDFIPYAEARLKEVYPKHRPFKIKYSVTISVTDTEWGVSPEEVLNRANRFIESGACPNWFAKNMQFPTTGFTVELVPDEEKGE